MKCYYENLDYNIDDENILHIKIDLNRCTAVKPEGQYVVARTAGYEEIWDTRTKYPEKTGLQVQLYLHAPRKRPEQRRQVSERWPNLELAAKALIEDV